MDAFLGVQVGTLHATVGFRRQLAAVPRDLGPLLERLEQSVAVVLAGLAEHGVRPATGDGIAAAGVGIPLPINWGLPGRPTWGAEAKQNDRDYFSHSMAVAMFLHDMPQHDNRFDLDPKGKDAWELPVARITLQTHQNDIDQGKFLVDRCGEILDAAPAKQVDRIYAEKVTGNCSHQHGTARMGDNPELSVLDRNCRAHEVDNLFIVDGSPFPTATGANPTLTIMANAWRVSDHILSNRAS